MSRRILASITLAFTSLGFAAGINGCSAAPEDTAVGSASQALEKNVEACTTPFTSRSDVCAPYCVSECVGVTQKPTPSDTWTGPLPTPTPIAPPAALAALGCTWGAKALFVGDGNFWACPASTLAQIPDYLGTISCPKYRPAGTPACEFVAESATVSANPVVGNADPGWILVQEGYADPWAFLNVPDGGAIGGGCAGGCPGLGE
jgi:hypothetical protein